MKDNLGHHLFIFVHFRQLRLVVMAVNFNLLMLLIRAIAINFIIVSLNNFLSCTHRKGINLNLIFIDKLLKISLIQIVKLHYILMGKKQTSNQNQSQSTQKNKGHKTLRDKLRKKREELKQHKKEKSERKKQYDAEGKRRQFFEKSSKSAKRSDGIKENKLKKHLETFIDIYEDDVEHFYEIFQTLDEGGDIDISEVADPEMRACLKKIFKYLPIKRMTKKLEYKIKDNVEIRLMPLMRQLLTKVIQNYMENGTDDERMKQESSEEIPNQNALKVRKQQKISSPIQNNQDPLQEYEEMRLYKKEQEIGPSIPQEHRQRLAELFEEQLKQGIHSKQQQQPQQQPLKQNEDDEFNRIFSHSTARKGKNPSKSKGSIQQVPEHLLAEGSAKIGQKQQVDYQQIEEYNKIHRPRKLIEQHQEMMKLGKYAQNGKKQRKPFDRERDIVYGQSKKYMNNGVFFDFKERMTKPKGENNFL